MFSRAHLLIERDYESLQDQQLWGIDVTPIKENSLFEWTARILGLQGTDWEGGVFRLYIKFDEHYKQRPPEVCFHTIPFHPNVDMITGRPCIDFLDDLTQWNESYSLSSILLTIQSMLSSPSLDNAVNTEAVNLIICSPHSYTQMVQDCVSASQRVEAGVSPHPDDVTTNGPPIKNEPSENKNQPQNRQPPKQTQVTTGSQRKSKKVISFEDYYTTWSGIATSKADQETVNPLLDAIKEDPVLQSAHYGLPIEELQAQMEKQIKEHTQLVYGKFRGKAPRPTDAELQEAKLEKISQMRKIYLQPKGSPRRTPISLAPTRDPTLLRGEPWEDEVDNLVAWTNKLDADDL